MIKQVELTDEQKEQLEEIRQALHENCRNEEDYQIKKMTILGYAVKEIVQELFGIE